MSAPDSLLAYVKTGLGITNSDSDAWLQQRINAVWARMEVYTSRKLCAPPQQFIDDWGQIAVPPNNRPMPPALWSPPRTTVFLRYFPVASIDEVEIGGASIIDVGEVQFDPKTGKVLSLGNAVAYDLSRSLFNEQARITYKAGWTDETLPADLCEVVLGAVSAAWSARSSGAGGIGGTPTSVSLIDVGTVEVAQGTAYSAQANKAPGGAYDPLLGPWANLLDMYIDHRSRIGWAMQPTTSEVAAPEPPP